MRKNLKKIMALGMAGTLMCSSITVFADTVDGTSTGTGSVEGIVNKDVFKVELPTVAANDARFNFILDPQNLINDTSAAKHTGATFTGTTGIYFETDTNTYTAESPAIKAINKSTMPVDVTVTATVKDLDSAEGAANPYAIVMTEDNTFAGDTSTSLYLAIKTADQTEAVVNSTKTATLKESLDAAPEGSYQVVYDTDYKYELKADATGFDEMSFNLTGACNMNADWANAKDAAPAVDVVWTVTNDKAPSVPATATAVSGSDAQKSIPVDFGVGALAATKVTGVQTNFVGINAAYSANSNVTYNSATNAINLNSTVINNNVGKTLYIKVTFDDAAKTVGYVTVSIVSDKAPSAPANVSVTSGAGVTKDITVDLGAGSLAATSVSSVQTNFTGITSSFSNNSNVTYDSATNTVKLNATVISGNVGKTLYIKVTFNDAAQTVAYITVTIN